MWPCLFLSMSTELAWNFERKSMTSLPVTFHVAEYQAGPKPCGPRSLLMFIAFTAAQAPFRVKGPIRGSPENFGFSIYKVARSKFHSVLSYKPRMLVNSIHNYAGDSVVAAVNCVSGKIACVGISLTMALDCPFCFQRLMIFGSRSCQLICGCLLSLSLSCLYFSKRSSSGMVKL